MSTSDTGSRNPESGPVLRKAQSVAGANLVLRDATERDAAFILRLRLDPVKKRHLAPTSSALEDQVEWLRRYALARDQAYFVICDRQGVPLGCVRLHDPVGASCCWGSWLMVSGLPPLVAIESNLLVYAYARWLGFEEARFDVRRENSPVWKFHEKFSGALRVRETERNYFYVVRKEQIDKLLRKYRHLLTDPLAVVPAPG